ncbi:hypothetical protein ALC60_03266 [Trachymyrmex zeteki]|uniref:Uncharacterized protein n=1 Tax=Mycetomoellerius zeteki TaxID=64791 RepID=A0A151XBP3_9HYME|nr:hypothetical protein ALC60_03266 [Trachymyrmex zeteki]
MSELPSDGRKLGDGQGQLFILLVQQQWGSPVTSQRRLFYYALTQFLNFLATCMTLLWSKSPCYTSLGAFSVFSSRWEATVRRFYSFSRRRRRDAALCRVALGAGQRREELTRPLLLCPSRRFFVVEKRRYVRFSTLTKTRACRIRDS